MKFDPDVVGVRTLLRLVEQDLGYPARLQEEEGGSSGEDPSEKDRRFWLRRFLSDAKTVRYFNVGMAVLLVVSLVPVLFG